MHTQPSPDATPLWRRAAAYACYLWGLSMHQWGLFTHERSFFYSARGSFSRAARLWPLFTSAYYRRAITVSRELSDPVAGMEDFDRAIACDPTRPELYLHRGLLARFHGDPARALADLRQFLALAPNSNWRGEAERQIQQLEAETE